MAKELKKANCAKGKVGAVIVLNDKVLGKGNNSVPNNCKPCTIDNCLRKKYNLKQDENKSKEMNNDNQEENIKDNVNISK